MNSTELIKRLKQLKIQTGSIACLGCGYEHDCSIRGCRIIREAISAIESAGSSKTPTFGMKTPLRKLDRYYCPICGAPAGYHEGMLFKASLRCHLCNQELFWDNLFADPNAQRAFANERLLFSGLIKSEVDDDG